MAALPARSKSSENEVCCAVCLSPVDADMLQLDCGHIYCRGCLVQWFSLQINENKLDLVCTACMLPVERWILEAVLPPEVMEKYDRFDLQRTLEREFNLFNCPNAACRNIVAAPDGAKCIQCPECKKEYCMECKVEWHRGINCAKYKEWAAENKDADALTLVFLQRGGGKQCPKCRVWIEKNQGCDHMTCRKCKYQFWWSTLEPYPHGRSGWEPNPNIGAGLFAPLDPLVAPVLPAPRPPPLRIPVQHNFLGNSSSFGEAARAALELRNRAAAPAAPVVPAPIAPAINIIRPPNPPPEEVGTAFGRAYNLFLDLSEEDQARFVRQATAHRNLQVPEGPYTRERMGLMTVVQLRAVCRSRGLNVSGNKNELIERILA